MWRLRTLASQMLLGILGVLLVTTGVGAVLYGRLARQTLDGQYEERARTAADMVAALADVQHAVAAGDPQNQLQPLAQRLAEHSGLTYIVITDRTGLRFSHPNPQLVGHRLEEPVAALDGRDHVGVDNGSLGRSANGKAPVLDSSGQVIGQVSVGTLESQVASEASAAVPTILEYSALALLVGTAAALLMARALKRLTFGLELRQIAALLQEREAMLYGIHEGVIGFDTEGRVRLINDQARRLLRIRENAIGRRLTDLLPPGRLRSVLAGEIPGTDHRVITDEALLVVNRRPAVVAGRDAGSVATLQDRTELEGLVRRMNAISGLTDALRAQQHEFVNRLHVLAGLLDLGEHEEARRYLTVLGQDDLASAEALRARIAPPALAALLVAKQAVANEHGVELVVTEDSHLDAPEALTLTLTTVLGNLIDNAIEAVAAAEPPRTVTVALADDVDISLEVVDTGPGVSPADAERVFADGYTTKTALDGAPRGVGLALVRRVVRRAGGTVDVTPGPNGRFTVHLPARRPATSLADTDGALVGGVVPGNAP
jgi:two-component system, CitB family, sensor kinase